MDKTAIEHSEKWVAKIENEWMPNDPERWMFNSLAEMLDFLKNELTADDLHGYDADEFFSGLEEEEEEEEANEEGCAIRTLKNGSFDVFSCPLQHFS
jgi:hypothetical protein